MVRLTIVAMVLFACKQKHDEDKVATPKMAADAAAVVAPVVDAAPEAKTADELAKRYDECIRHTNEGRWDELRNCYIPNITFEAPGLDAGRTLDVELAARQKARAEFPDEKEEPQLALISGNTIISILLITATSKKTKKPIGFLLGHVVGTDPQGKFIRDIAFFDAKTVEGQAKGAATVRGVTKGFPTKIALISKADDVEKTNLATFEKMMAASEQRDLATFGSMIADDVVWSVQNRPKDLTKAEILDGIKLRLEKTDLHYKIEHAWAAGDYVASIERVTGTATADSPDKKIKKGDKIDLQLLAVHRFAGGKLAQVWVFAQG
jgi:ketosteroid isomerase-like protein